MSRLKEGLRSMLDLDRRGGKLFQRDNETIVLTDCSSFTSEQLECLQTVYPQVRANVVQSDVSLSGFLVIFQLASPGFTRTTALLVLNTAFLLGGLCALWRAYANQIT